MPPKRLTTEQIIRNRHEAEVLRSQGSVIERGFSRLARDG
ncbi:hypothetical protein Pan189_36880 [Stratiformator vulcanicus]|uniref:Uncharacterized protein n=1 Tax=Stratiformator vulcanicus TaxID=2527980 RepID=A0A517R628_9PLAN|nr:hypothetical protein Pan189_36880 [Stratiformator vulcanicus]